MAAHEVPPESARRTILIEALPGETRIAILEDDLLAELHIERHADRAVAGNVYNGRVSNVLPGMQAAFVNVGLERDAFLYVEDVLAPVATWEGLAGIEIEPEAPPTEGAGPLPPSPAGAPRARVEDLLRPGQELVVQITKEPIGPKGARISAHVSLAGRLMVYLPTVAHCGVSRRIAGAEERERLRGVARALATTFTAGGGFIVRTAGEGLAAEAFEAEARALVERWTGIRAMAETRAAPSLLHEEAGAVEKVLRDWLGPDVRQVVVEGEAAFREAARCVQRMQPDLAPRLREHAGDAPLFAAHHVDPQIARALRPRVWLRSGGSIVIHQTEALVAIDVNTGKYVGTRHPEETILKTNLEAVREIVRQLRLRDLGGIIVVDFIDMERPESRAQVAAALEGELRRDRARSRMLQISEFGLVEITRQRSRRSLDRILLEPCAACQGAGRVRSAETVFLDVVRWLRGFRGAAGAPVVRAHPRIASYLEENRGRLEALAGITPGGVIIRVEPSLPPGQFAGETGPAGPGSDGGS